MAVRITGKVTGMVIGNGRTVTNTFVNGELVSSVIDGRDDAERKRRYDLVASQGVPDDMATWYADLSPDNEALARKMLTAEYGVSF
jgi:hypothetical protein